MTFTKYLLLTVSVFLCLSGFPQSDLPIAKPGPDDELSFEDIEGNILGCNLACGIGWTTSVTSTLASQGNNSYDISNMEDAVQSTAWVEGKEDYGIGERLIFTMETSNKEALIPFDGIVISNGYTKNEMTWKNNSRVKSFKVYHNQKPKLIIELPDTYQPQKVYWDPQLIKLKHGDVVAFEITEVYKGDKYTDTAISDFTLKGAH